MNILAYNAAARSPWPRFLRLQEKHGLSWTPKQSGKQTMTVTVRDQSQQTQKASTTIFVMSPLKVKLETDPAGKTAFFVGETVVLTAEISGGSPDYDLVWSGGPVGKEPEASWVADKPGEMSRFPCLP